MKQQEKDEKKRKISNGAASGATAIIFLIIGFQAAVLLLKVLEPSTAVEPTAAGPQADVQPVVIERQAAPAPRAASSPRPAPVQKRNYKSTRKVESFRFNPNTVTLEELVRLGLSEKQAGAILNYREKGGKFRCKEDFKKMYTVSDTLYERLEKFIDIPKLELNSADSAKLVSLKGIGPYYAKLIIEYRAALGGFYEKEQLLEIKGMDSTRYEGLKESVRVNPGAVKKFRLDTISEEQLAKHPYFGKNCAKAICRLRKIEIITDSILLSESILEPEMMKKIKNYIVFEKK